MPEGETAVSRGRNGGRLESEYAYHRTGIRSMLSKRANCVAKRISVMV